MSDLLGVQTFLSELFTPDFMASHSRLEVGATYSTVVNPDVFRYTALGTAGV